MIPPGFLSPFRSPLLRLVVLTGFCLPPGLSAQEIVPESDQDQAPVKQDRLSLKDRLDRVYRQMALATHSDEADDLEEQLLLITEQMVGPTGELLLEWSRQAFEAQNFARALEFADAAAAAFPDLVVAYYAQARALDALGDKQRALLKAAKALEVDSRFVPAYHLLASLFLSFENRSLALDAARQGLLINPRSSSLNALLTSARNGFERSI